MYENLLVNCIAIEAHELEDSSLQALEVLAGINSKNYLSSHFYFSENLGSITPL